MKRFIFTLFVLGVSFSPIYSGDSIGTIKDLVTFGKSNSNTLKSSYLELSKSKDNIEGILKLDTSKISLSTNFNNFDTSISIPIIDQLSLTASVDNNLNKSVGISLQPFNHSATRENSNISYNIQESNSKNIELQVEEEIVKNSLNWLIAAKSEQIKEMEFLLQDDIYTEDKIRYEAGDITLDDLRDSLLSWSQARKSYLSATQTLSTAELSMYSSLGVKKGDVDIVEITLDELIKELEDLKSTIDLNNLNIVKTNSYLVSYYNLEISKNSIDSTWLYNPNLSANINLGIDGDNNPSYSASVNFTLGIDDFTAKDKKLLEDQYAIEESEHYMTVETLKENLNTALNNLESSSINSDISKIEVEQSELLLNEAKILLNSGTYSQLEYKSIELQFLNSELSLYSSIVEEYLNWLSIKKYL